MSQFGQNMKLKGEMNMKKGLKIAGIVLGLMIFVGACAAAEEEETTAPIVEETATPETEPEPVEAEEPIDNSELEDIALELFQDNFEGTADISFDRETKTYSITPTGSMFETELVMMMEGTKSMDDWNEITVNMEGLSDELLGLLGSGYAVVMVNPANTDNVLLMAMDGVLIYDAFNE